ncbi:DNA topoisomerase 3-alpha (DNA topoisomerase III alpha) [Durusdinium trenchii]|uniref:DNA topoisomerase 3-alpha (DNA topoisomerase III alpha) n=1 Tax=Durusdinium trenchii TaxID=1381693 RepID=A0ABP0SBQ4_9DINO
MSGSAEAPGTEESFQPWRDKDPPPGFDGDVEKFKGYLRELKMWRHETDVPPKKHAVKMLRALTGPAKAVCNELEVEALLTEAGADAIVAKLKEYYQPHLETAMPRAFERAVYGEARRNKESFGEFIVRQDALFRELREEGVTLDDTVRGYIMFRQANLSQTQEDQITTWTQGKFDRPAIMAALRKLEKVQRERGGGKHFLTAEEEPTEVPESDDDGEYIYLGEADLDQVFEEEELTEALATYQQVRQAIREQRNGRGYYQPKGLGKQPGGRFGKGSKSSQTSIKFGGKGTKVHIDVLKLRTRCARCGQIGHWAKECTNEPDARGKSRAPSEGTSPKSGFFETGMIDGESSTNTFQVTLGQCLARAREERLRSAAPFSGITTSGSLGIIDTAAQGGLIGRPALRRLEESLKGHGLRVVWNGKQAQAKGIGGDAKVCGVVEIPVGIGGVNGLIEATVVEDEVPFLLSIQFLKQVGAIVNLQESSLALTAFDKSSCIHHMPSGHVAVQVLDFHEQGWQLPDLAGATTSQALAMDLIARIRRLDQEKVEEWEKVSMTDPRRSERAVRNWRVMVEHVADLMEFVKAREKLVAWQPVGLVHGLPPCSSFTQLASGSEPFSCLDGATPLQITKASIYAELIQLGEFLGQRKCKEAPSCHFKACSHPLAALAGAGNQVQREVWCRKCHARWAVDSRVMEEIAGKKKAIHVNGKTFHLGSSKTAMDKKETPPGTPVKTPSAKRAIKWPTTPGSPLTPPRNAEQLSTPKTAILECHCRAPAVQLIVKKEGPTQGRLFWKCAQRVCNFFEWDPQEVQEIQRRMLQEREDAEMRKWEEQEEADRQELVRKTMEMAEIRHQEVMDATRSQHSLEVETLKNQLLWMSAVAGEARMEEVFKSPVLQQEMMNKAMAMKEELTSQELQAQEAMQIQGYNSGSGSTPFLPQ